jgi:hypothetical protein
MLRQALERAVGKLSLPTPAGASLLVEASGLQTDRVHRQLIKQERWSGRRAGPFDLATKHAEINAGLGNALAPAYNTRRHIQ